MLTEKKIYRIATVIIFLALIRCAAEPFRLQYYSAVPPSFAAVMPFVAGALVAAVALFLMTLCSFREWYKMGIALASIALAALILLRIIYL